MMIVYIAQLQSIPDNLIEAAEIDGAGRLQPVLKKFDIAIMYAGILQLGFFLTLSGTFRLYDQNLAFNKRWTLWLYTDGMYEYLPYCIWRK